MFKISYIVDDKRLPDMLRACAGHVYSLDVVPVTNAEPVQPIKGLPKPKLLLPPPAKVKEASTGPRNFIQELGWESGKRFTGGDVAPRCKSIGLDVASRWYVIGYEVKHKRVKKIGLGKYEVV